MPGILIYCIYSILGGVIADFSTPDDTATYTVAFANLPDSYEALFEDSGRILAERIESDDDSLKEAKSRLAEGEISAIFVFPETLADTPTATPPTVEAYYDSLETDSAQSYAFVSALLSSVQQIHANFQIAPIDVASVEDAESMMLAMIAPMLLVIFLATGCLALVPESIAGEKERGSFSTMLVTPVKRSHIAAGKIVALSAISLVSGACSFLGLVLSLPKILQSTSGGLSISSVSYSFSDYLALFFVILSTVLTITALLSILSAFAKSVKEANSYASPLMIVIAVVAMANMFLGETAGTWPYFIPLFNSVKAMSDVFSFSYSPWAIFATTASNCVFSAIFSFALAKMFDSEKITAS